MNKAGLYLRVSTEEQKDKGHSLEYPKNRLLDYCEKNELNDYKFYDDGGYSAKDENRPAYQKMLKDIRNQKICKIIFLKIDRVSRSVLDYKNLSSICLVNNVEMISLTEDIKMNAISEFSQGIIIALAEMERKQISERTKAGIVGMLEKGMYPFGGKLPLGLSKTIDKKIVFNEDIEKVKWVYQKFCEGNNFAGISRLYFEHWNIKVNKNYIGLLIKNDLYSGVLEYQGQKYQLFDGLENWKEKPKLENKRVRNIKEHKYVLDYLLPDFNKTTAKKKIISTGEVKEYKYYIYKKNKKIKINEEKLLSKVTAKMNISKNKIKSIKTKKLEKLNELYVLTKMSINEFNTIKEKIKDKTKQIATVDEIKKIDIDNSGIIEVLLESKRRIKFNYQSI